VGDIDIAVLDSLKVLDPRRPIREGDMAATFCHVRFTPNNGHQPSPDQGLLSAMCGRLRIGKDFLHVAGLVGAAMCSAFKCGSHDRWP